MSLAHNVRERDSKGRSRPKPVIVARLGREDQLDDATVEAIRDAFDRYLNQRRGEVTQPLDDTQVRRLRVLASREFGLRTVVDRVWRDLGLRDAMRDVGRARQVHYDFERAVFAMVLNRLAFPCSKLACNEWVRNQVWFPEAEDWTVDVFYSALDILDEHADDLMAAVCRAARAQLSEDEFDLVLLDTTSSYFESELDDVERHAVQEAWDAFDADEGPRPTDPRPQVVNEPPMRLRGHSKDNHPREPQVVLGLACTQGGEVLHAELFPGNTSDQRITMQLVETVQEGLGARRLVFAMDSGMGGSPNLHAMDQLENVDRVSAVPIRRSKFAEDELLSKAGRWTTYPHKPGFTYRYIHVAEEESPSGRAELWIARRNARNAARQKRQLDRDVAMVKGVLERDSSADHHGLPTCKMLSKAKLKRLIRLSKNGKKYVLNRDRIRRERRMAGVIVIRSTLVDLDAARSLEIYDIQASIEQRFRTYKGPLRLRPMHHRASRRIRAHMLVCTMALTVMTELERRTEQRWTHLHRTLSGIQAIQVQQGPIKFWQREDWSEDAKAILQRLNMPEGALMWGTEAA